MARSTSISFPGWLPVVLVVMAGLVAAVIAGAVKAAADAYARAREADAKERDTNFWEGVANAIKTAAGSAASLVA